MFLYLSFSKVSVFDFYCQNAINNIAQTIRKKKGEMYRALCGIERDEEYEKISPSCFAF